MADHYCADCQFWVPTEMEVYRPDAQPHEARGVAMETEMLRATHALCNWSSTDEEAAALFAKAPPWIKRSHAAGGTLTREDDGADCQAWRLRQPAKCT